MEGLEGRGEGKVRLSFFPKRMEEEGKKFSFFPSSNGPFLSPSLSGLYFFSLGRIEIEYYSAGNGPSPLPPSSSFPLPPRRREKKGKRAIFGSAKTGRIIAGPVNISWDFFHIYFSPGIETLDPPLGCKDAVSP